MMPSKRCSLQFFLNKFPLAKIFNSINRAGRDSFAELYIVGGTVRDIYLKKTLIVDIDIAVDGDVLLFSQNLSKLLNSHIIRLGKIPATYRIPFKDSWIDITKISGTIEQDLKRRDFTVNSVAIKIPSGEIIDVTGGLSDIKKGILRASYKEAFLEDPVRILRLFSLSADLRFSIDKKTKRLAIRALQELNKVPAERVKQEMVRLFHSKRVYPTVVEMTGSGVWDILLPEVRVMRRIKGGRYHKLSIWKHSLEALKYLDSTIGAYYKYIDNKKIWVLRLGLLLHDIGKPKARKHIKGRYTFYRHESIGAHYCDTISKRFNLSNEEEHFLKVLIKMHMRPGLLMERGFPEKGVRRLLKDGGNDIIEILLISACDLRTVRPIQAGKMLTFLRRIVSGYYDKEKLQIKPFLMGRDILKLGLKPSPTIGKILKKILEKQIQGNIKTREQALEYAKKIVDSR